MSSVMIWKDDLSGVQVEWRKHLGSRNRPGYVVESNDEHPLTNHRNGFHADEASAIAFARKQAHSRIKAEILDALANDRGYLARGMGLHVDQAGETFVVDHVSRGYSSQAPRLRIGEFRDIAKAASAAATILVSMTDLKRELNKFASRGEFPSNVRCVADVERHFNLACVIDAAVDDVVPGKDPAVSQVNALRWAVRHGVERWLAADGLSPATRSGTGGVLPYEVRAILASEGEFVHEVLGLTITRTNGQWVLASPIMSDHGKIGETVIGASMKPDWAASVLGALEHIAFDGRVEIFSKVFGGHLAPDAPTPYHSPGFVEWLEENVTPSVIGLPRTDVLTGDIGQSYASLRGSVARSLEAWMGSTDYRSAVQIHSKSSPNL